MRFSAFSTRRGLARTAPCGRASRGCGRRRLRLHDGNTRSGGGREIPGKAFKVAQNCTLAEDEIDLDIGFLMVPAAVPVEAPPPPKTCPTCGKSPCECATPPAVCPRCGRSPCECQSPPVACPKCGKSVCTCQKVRTSIRIAFPASRDDVFKSFQAIANLADKSDDGKIKIVVEGECAAGYDPSWLRNAVQEPLDEANIEGMEIS